MWARSEESRLATAIEQGELVKIDQLMDSVDLTARNTKGLNFLHVAATSFSPESLSLVLEKLKNNTSQEIFWQLLNARTNTGCTPLIKACKGYQATNIRLLLQYSPITYLEDNKGVSFFNYLTASIGITFRELNTEAKEHILKEHRYYLLLNRDKKQLALHKKWANHRKLKLKTRLNEHFWLQRENLSPSTLQIVNSDFDMELAKKCEVLGLAKSLETRLSLIKKNLYMTGSLFPEILRVFLGHSLFNSLLRKLNYNPISPEPSSFFSLKTEKYLGIARVSFAVLVIISAAILGLVGGGIIGALLAGFVGLVAAAPFISLGFGIVCALAGTAIGIHTLISSVKSLLTTTKKLKAYEDDLVECIKEALPIAKELLKQLEKLNNESVDTEKDALKSDIEKLKECITTLEQTDSDEDSDKKNKIAQLLELSGLLKKNVGYVKAEEPLSLETVTASTQEKKQEHIVIDISENVQPNKLLSDLPKVSKNPNASFYSRLHKIREENETAPLLARRQQAPSA